MPTAFLNQAHLANEVAQAIQKLGPEVVRVRYNVGEDMSGDRSIFFRIVLTDEASREETLADVTDRIALVFEELRPYENWGLIPYFSFRSHSEQSARHDLAWA